MSSFNPARLDLARRRRGLTKGQLAAAAGITTRVLHMYEHDEVGPGDETVRRIATALEFPVEFFMRADAHEPAPTAISFRARSTMSKRQENQATSASAFAIELIEWIEERFELPTSTIPRYDDRDPESAADLLRAEWNLGEKRIGNLVQLLEQHGVRVFSLAEENEDVDAYSFWRDGVPYVFLNSMKSAERSRMDAAHELGHLVMHFWDEGPSGRDAENEAKTFGGAFLMPRRSVLAQAPRGPSVTQILRAKKQWNVSAIALAYRMNKVGMLTEWQARTVYKEMARRGFRSDEPNGIERETSQVLAKVFAVLREEGTSQADIAKELAIPQPELQKMIFGLVLSAAPSRGRQVENERAVSKSRGHLSLVQE